MTNVCWYLVEIYHVPTDLDTKHMTFWQSVTIDWLALFVPNPQELHFYVMILHSNVKTKINFKQVSSIIKNYLSFPKKYYKCTQI